VLTSFRPARITSDFPVIQVQRANDTTERIGSD